MKRIETDHPDVLEYREPTTWWILLSLPFGLLFLALAVGLVVYAVFMFGCVLNGHGDLNPLLLIFVGLFGLVLLAKAAQLVGMLERWWFRVGVIVDRRRRVASKCWGFLVPLSLFEYDLDVYDSLFVVQETRRCRSSIDIRYLLYLAGPDNRRILIGRSERSDEIARMKADIVAFVAAGARRPVEFTAR